MLLTEIDHVAIAVRDLEAAIDYYKRAFGATVDHREVVESDGVEEALLKGILAEFLKKYLSFFLLA